MQLTVNAVKSDDSVANVTGQAQWTSSDRRVIDIGPTGVAKAMASGEARIDVRYQSRGASTSTMVLPPGTYRLNGSVTDSGIRLPGVLVTVIEGLGQGLTTATNENGRTRFTASVARSGCRRKARGSSSGSSSSTLPTIACLTSRWRSNGSEPTSAASTG